MIKPFELVPSFSTRIQEEEKVEVERTSTKVEEPPQILIVDDNTFNVFSLKLLIEEYFYLRTDTAYSAKEAIEKVQTILPWALSHID
jgi:PleD family two-component response regulator